MKTVVGKLVILGEQGVGKTSMVVRYVENSFNSQISPTIGASFFTCKICVDDVVVKLQIWDTAGQERFKAMAPMFYRNANAALLVFDITRPKSFESMKTWAHELKGNVEEPMALCVVGNKIDLGEERTVLKEEAVQYANSIGATYFECSVKEGQGVDQIFTSVATGVVRLTTDVHVRTLKIYEGDVDAPLMARSSELKATDVGRIEEPGGSIVAFAHASEVPSSKCC